MRSTPKPGPSDLSKNRQICWLGSRQHLETKINGHEVTTPYRHPIRQRSSRGVGVKSNLGTLNPISKWCEHLEGISGIKAATPKCPPRSGSFRIFAGSRLSAAIRFAMAKFADRERSNFSIYHLASRKGFEPLTYGLGIRQTTLCLMKFLYLCRACVALGQERPFRRDKLGMGIALRE